MLSRILGGGSAPFGFVLRRDIAPDIKVVDFDQSPLATRLLPSGALAGRRGVDDDLPSNEKHEPSCLQRASNCSMYFEFGTVGTFAWNVVGGGQQWWSESSLAMLSLVAKPVTATRTKE